MGNTAAGGQPRNYFTAQETARRYARSRPFFHPAAMERIAGLFDAAHPPERALDVGCGTGQSTRALAAIASDVVGADPAMQMLAQGEASPGLHRVGCAAEALAFADGTFDLVTVALAFHWFDRTRFLKEAARVARPSGWLVIYDDTFQGRMVGNEDFRQWVKAHYATRFPPPARDRRPITDEEARDHGFRLAAQEKFEHEEPFSAVEMASYLLTQSNTITAVERGENPTEIRDWILEAITPILAGESGLFPFTCRIDTLQRSDQFRSARLPDQTARFPGPQM